MLSYPGVDRSPKLPSASTKVQYTVVCVTGAECNAAPVGSGQSFGIICSRMKPMYSTSEVPRRLSIRGWMSCVATYRS